MMPQELPFVSCLCPTYYRPELLRNAVQCFLDQSYPADRRELIILDDAGQYETMDYQTPNGLFRVISTSSRYETLPHKFNELVCLSQGDVLAVWEDDDLYLKHHLRDNVQAMLLSQKEMEETPLASKWGRVISCYGGKVFTEPSDGRFHASLVFNRKAIEECGGWPLTKRADFDQQFIALLKETCGGFLDPKANVSAIPQYAFRWEGSNNYHGQNTMRSPDDETWYDRIHELPSLDTRNPVTPYISPKYDADTEEVNRLLKVPELLKEILEGQGIEHQKV